MKTVLASLFAVAILAGGAFAEKSPDTHSRFYGKIVSVDQTQHNFTVHNAKLKTDSTFRWDDKTGVVFNNKSIAPSDLKVGQSLAVSYVTQDDVNHAMKVNVRTPFKRKTATQ